MRGQDVGVADSTGLALVTGATGYIGSRLVPELLDAGWRVRTLSRDPDKLAERPWRDRVDIVQGDATEPGDLAEALAGVDVAYYLLHSMDAQGDLARRDRELATAFSSAAADAGVGRIIYLGGLHPDGEKLSEHLASRTEVGDILLAGPAPTTVLQAAVILGSGSASFEMLRYLTDRLPMMVAPRWLSNRVQPIAIRDVLHYLVGSAGMPADVNRSFDIGGPDVLTYRELMQRYADAAGLSPRLVVVVPALTPRLASHWVGLVTPVPRAIAKPLVGSLLHEVVCAEHDIAKHVMDPAGALLGVNDAVRLALAHADDFPASPHGRSAAGPLTPSDGVDGDPDWAGGTVFRHEQHSCLSVSAEQAWQAVESVGGDKGWHIPDAVCEAGGLADRLLGGPGRRRGRPQRQLRVGDAVDCWRVEDLQRGQRLLLRSETRLPGTAWLELTVEQKPEGTGSTLRQCLVFRPRGLVGQSYWRAMLPARLLACMLMHRGMVGEIEAADTATAAARS